jgi:hypothetical protein
LPNAVYNATGVRVRNYPITLDGEAIVCVQLNTRFPAAAA